MKFKDVWVEAGFQTKEWYKESMHDVLTCDRYRIVDRNTNYDKSIVIAHLTNFITPPKQGFGSRLFTPAMNGKRQKINAQQQNNYSIMLILTDAMNLELTFALLFKTKADYQHLFGPAMSEQIIIGDTVAFLGLRPSEESLGGKIMVLGNPRLGVAIKPTIHIWPTKNPKAAEEAGEQKGFYCNGKQLALHRIQILKNTNVVPCTNTSCDRQIIKNHTCFGKSNAFSAIVMKCEVRILDTIGYEPQYSYTTFDEFRSFRFSTLFFKNINTFANVSTDLAPSIWEIEDSVTKITKHINNNGGWTVVGWHRLGEIVDPDTGEKMISTTTNGHLVHARPTNLSILNTNQYKELLIETPEYTISNTDATAATTNTNTIT